MEIIYYPDSSAVQNAMRDDDPLLVLVAFDVKQLLASNIDDAFEHVILLRKCGYPETDIDHYFRLVVNKSGADWTFVCPNTYKNITNKNKRIEKFYNDGFKIIPSALKQLGYDVKVEIPQRYQRHIKLI